MPIRYPRRAGMALATGQTTQYSSELDDGNYEKGIAKAYTILTTGQYSATSNVDLAHYTGSAGAIAFDNVAKTITDTGNGLAIFKTNDVIVTNATNNPGPFTVTTGNVAGTITCSGATFVTETPGGAITISKRESRSNNCVLDLNTGLMWNRYGSANMGSTSVGDMPWTGELYDIFQYVAAANTANLGGHADWRIPNLFEYFYLKNYSLSAATPDTTAFASLETDALWTATTNPSNTANALVCYLSGGGTSVTDAAKTSERPVYLVRGG